MKRKESVVEMKELNSIFSQKFVLPPNFQSRVKELEANLEQGTLTHTTMKELFELYTVSNLIKDSNRQLLLIMKLRH